MTAVDTLREALFGSPPSETYKPDRNGVLNAFTQIHEQVFTLQLGVDAYATVADLPTVTVVDDGTSARVYNDLTSTNNTYWVVVDGAWQIDADLVASVATIVQPLVDEAEAYSLGTIADLTNDNYFLAYAGNTTQTGANNIAFGPSASSALTTGDRNLSAGKSAGRLNTTGSDNVMLGDEAGDGFTVTAGCTVVGSGAFARGSGSSADANTVVGAFAARNFSGEGMTAIGRSALASATGARSTAIGAYAGSDVATGINQILIGYNALGGAALNNTIVIAYNMAATASNQIVLGNGDNDHMRLFGENFARYFDDSNEGDNCWIWNIGPTTAPTRGANMGVGIDSLISITSGYYNTTLGFEAGKAATTMINTVAIGALAAKSAVDLDDSVFVGARSGELITGGVGATAIGFRAMGKSTDCYNVTAVGDSAGWLCQSYSAVFMGYIAGEFIDDATNAVIIGATAGAYRANAQRCVFIGKSAGAIDSNGPSTNNATGTGAIAAGVDNVGIGSTAMHECLGSRVTAVGSNVATSIVGTTDQDLSSCFFGFNSGTHASQKADAVNSMALGADTYTDKDNQVVIGDANVAETLLRGVTRHTTYTVAGLPSASTMGAGARAFVTDATATTFASNVAGGGANNVPVYSDGTNWKIG